MPRAFPVEGAQKSDFVQRRINVGACADASLMHFACGLPLTHWPRLASGLPLTHWPRLAGGLPLTRWLYLVIGQALTRGLRLAKRPCFSHWLSLASCVERTVWPGLAGWRLIDAPAPDDLWLPSRGKRQAHLNLRQRVRFPMGGVGGGRHPSGTQTVMAPAARLSHVAYGIARSRQASRSGLSVR